MATSTNYEMITESEVINEVCQFLRFSGWTINSRCDETEQGDDIIAVGPNREEATIEAKGETSSKGCDLQLIFAVKDVSGIPTEGKSLLIVASLDNGLHFRAFNRAGESIVDKGEAELPTKVRPIATLKKQLENVRSPHKPTREDDKKIVTAVASIVGLTRCLKPKSARWGEPFDAGQVKCHVANAYYRASQAVSEGKNPKKSGVAFPDNDLHRRYVNTIAPALKTLGITVFWVCPNRRTVSRIKDYGNWLPGCEEKLVQYHIFTDVIL